MAKLYFATDPKRGAVLSKQYRNGELHRIRAGVYSDSADPQEIEPLLKSRWADLAQYLFDNPVAVFRTAVELKPHQNHLYLTADGLKRRILKVADLSIHIEPGSTGIGVEPFLLNMRRSNVARQLLENLAPSRQKNDIKKTLGREWVEEELVKILQRRGEPGLNQLRDEARVLAPELGFDKEFATLNKLVAAILQTHPVEGILQTRAGLAQAIGEPFDTDRLDLFQRFVVYLQKLNLYAEPYEYSKAGWRNLAFFESYFSNYIEGTRFTIDEAEEIVSAGKTMGDRHQDSHDILSHIEVSGDLADITRVPDSADELVDILKVRHAILMAERPDKRPGRFKKKSNQAGSTIFVEPEKVEGTLVQGFELYKKLSAGMLRALFMHFLVAECHPFDDGNGRLARIMMNAELVDAGLHKIIVPSVCRDNYLNGMRLASRNQRFRTNVKVLHQLHQYTASIDWMDYADVRQTLEQDAADQDPDDGLMVFNRRLRHFAGDYQAG